MLSRHLISPLWNLWFRYCVFATMLDNNTEIIEVVRSYVLLNSVLAPSPSHSMIEKLLAHSIFSLRKFDWDIFCFYYRVQLQHKTTVFVWEIAFIQSKIEILNYMNCNWHKTIKDHCARGWGYKPGNLLTFCFQMVQKYSLQKSWKGDEAHRLVMEKSSGPKLEEVMQKIV